MELITCPALVLVTLKRQALKTVVYVERTRVLVSIEQTADKQASGTNVATKLHHCPVQLRQRLFELAQDDGQLVFADLVGHERVFRQ